MTGIVVFLLIIVVMTPPAVSTPREKEWLLNIQCLETFRKFQMTIQRHRQWHRKQQHRLRHGHHLLRQPLMVKEFDSILSDKNIPLEDLGPLGYEKIRRPMTTDI